MTILSTQEFTTQIPHVLDRLIDGEEFAIARDGVIIGRLTPLLHPEPAFDLDAVARDNAKLFALATPGAVPGGIDNEGIDRDLAREYGSSDD